MAEEFSAEDESAHSGEGLSVEAKQVLTIQALNNAKTKIAQYQGSDPEVMAQLGADFASHLADYNALEELRVNGKDEFNLHNPAVAGALQKALFNAVHGDQIKLKEVLLYEAGQGFVKGETGEPWQELNNGLRRIATSIPDRINVSKAKPITLANPAFLRGKK
jgi:hypothetical protein